MLFCFKMHLKFLVWILAFISLHLMRSDNGIEANFIEGNDQGETKRNHIEDHHESQHSHMDHSILVFFTLQDLKVGKTMPIFFRDTNPSKSPHFLPREEAKRIPFSSSKLPFLLNYFRFHHDSPQAQAMENTLRECETKPIKGETKFCATSLESMLDFVHQILGTRTEFRGLNTQELTTSTTSNNHYLQNYTIVGNPIEVGAQKMVACHTMPYPYAIFYCHYQEQKSKVFQVSLAGEKGSKVNAIAVCHMDTSQWSHKHVSFRVLGIEPGSSPVCHFFPADNLVWVPLLDANKGEMSHYKPINDM